jgi:hypothetical protein
VTKTMKILVGVAVSAISKVKCLVNYRTNKTNHRLVIIKLEEELFYFTQIPIRIHLGELPPMVSKEEQTIFFLMVSTIFGTHGGLCGINVFDCVNSRWWRWWWSRRIYFGSHQST